MSCPMSFGELNIPSSRAFWDDCDEDEPLAESAEKLQLVFEAGATEKAITSDLLLLIEGINIAPFAEKTLLSNEAAKICKIPAKSSSSLHYVKSKKMLIGILEDDLTSSGEVTALLLPYAESAKRVLTLTVKPKVDYKSEQIAKVRDEITFLRGINSTLKNVPELEAPNFIAGAAAGIASWRENKQLPVSSYVAYTDNIALDKLAAQPIVKLLQNLGIECDTTYTPKNKDDSHLYM